MNKYTKMLINNVRDFHRQQISLVFKSCIQNTSGMSSKEDIFVSYFKPDLLGQYRRLKYGFVPNGFNRFWNCVRDSQYTTTTIYAHHKRKVSCKIFIYVLLIVVNIIPLYHMDL